MTPEQKTLVRASYGQLLPLLETAAQLFYSRLFDLDPSLRQLFTTDVQDQAKKFTEMLSIVVADLESPDSFDRVLRDLAVRHMSYGVMDSYYDTVGIALLWAIEKSLGRGASAETRAAWAEFYKLVAGIMKDAA